jgi:hypothetical protein
VFFVFVVSLVCMRVLSLVYSLSLALTLSRYLSHALSRPLSHTLSLPLSHALLLAPRSSRFLVRSLSRSLIALANLFDLFPSPLFYLPQFLEDHYDTLFETGAHNHEEVIPICCNVINATCVCVFFELS